MTWFKVDDSLAGSKKFARIPRAERMACTGLWVTLGAWSARELTEGLVEAHMVEEVGGTQDQAQRLVQVGLWDLTADGSYQFRNWTEYQPSKDQVEAKRKAQRDRVARWRERQAEERARAAAEAEQNGPEPQDDHPAEEPKAKRRPPADTTLDQPGTREDVDRLCTLLADKVEANGSKRPNITKAWRQATRLLLDQDGKTEEQVAKCITWVQADEFWRANVMAMPTLRKQYDRLRLEAERKAAAAKSGGRPERPAPPRAQEPPAELLGNPTALSAWYDEQATLNRRAS